MRTQADWAFSTFHHQNLAAVLRRALRLVRHDAEEPDQVVE
jgi:hypothetical protein